MVYEVTYMISATVEAPDAASAVIRAQRSDDMVLKQAIIKELDHHGSVTWSEEILKQIRG